MAKNRVEQWAKQGSTQGRSNTAASRSALSPVFVGRKGHGTVDADHADEDASEAPEGIEMGRKVAIVGAALSDCGRVDDKTAYQLHHQATTRALADAGISRNEVDGFMSHGTGNLPPIELAEYLGFANHIDYIDSTGVGGSCWEIFLEHAVAAIAQGPDRDCGPVLRVDLACRPEAPDQKREPLLRQPRPRPIRRAVRPHPDREARDVRAPPHVRVRHDDRAARRDRRIRQVQRRPQPTRLLPGPDHHRGRPVVADDRRPFHEAPLLHPFRRRRRDRPHE